LSGFEENSSGLALEEQDGCYLQLYPVSFCIRFKIIGFHTVLPLDKSSFPV
jgi:hypothetical protein